MNEELRRALRSWREAVAEMKRVNELYSQAVQTLKTAERRLADLARLTDED